MENITTIQDTNGELEIRIYTKLMKFKKPKYSPLEAKENSQTYSSSLYIPTQLVYKKLYKSRIINTYFGEMPLITERGTFIINGSSRVIVNQIVRSPGIYYNQELSADNKKVLIGTIISSRGSWFRIEIDKDKFIWGKLDKNKKIPIFVLLQALGITKSKILKSIRHPEFLIKSLINGNPKSTSDALKQLQLDILNKNTTLITNVRDSFFSNFQDPQKYSLGKTGRIRLNKKLKLSMNPQSLTLRPEDILAATDYLINLEYK